MKCPKCSKEIDDNVKFCPECGTYVTKKEQANDTPQKEITPKSENNFFMSCLTIVLAVI